MFNYGQVVSQTAFQAWATGVQAKEQANGMLAALPPYALVYDPTVIPQLGKEPGQGRRHHRRRGLLLRAREPGDAMTRLRPRAAAHLKSTTTSAKG